MRIKFRAKCTLAKIFDALGVTKFCLYKLNKKYNNNYIRIINYHHTYEQNRAAFEKQIEWFSNKFEICNREIMERFLEGEYVFHKKPGMIITFDDGFKDNYIIANCILKKYNAVGFYMVSSSVIGKNNYRNTNGVNSYMSADDLKQLIIEGNCICCHTASHHRMSISDSEQILKEEIINSKKNLEDILESKIDIFCWCGGEAGTYTKAAADIIRKNYKYGMMTNNFPIIKGVDPFQLDRTNIDAAWGLGLTRFQVCGIMDLLYKKKRNEIHSLTR